MSSPMDKSGGETVSNDKQVPYHGGKETAGFADATAGLLPLDSFKYLLNRTRQCMNRRNPAVHISNVLFLEGGTNCSQSSRDEGIPSTTNPKGLGGILDMASEIATILVSIELQNEYCKNEYWTCADAITTKGTNGRCLLKTGCFNLCPHRLLHTRERHLHMPTFACKTTPHSYTPMRCLKLPFGTPPALGTGKVFLIPQWAWLTGFPRATAGIDYLPYQLRRFSYHSWMTRILRHMQRWNYTTPA
ncbi:hypothetical protein BKA82DRAFT_4414378 [Pisolithus tinctorius]|nr:hypothetical protein BKA82DRAFT_4414378 [Pisolithus tinctorius]